MATEGRRRRLQLLEDHLGDALDSMGITRTEAEDAGFDLALLAERLVDRGWGHSSHIASTPTLGGWTP